MIDLYKTWSYLIKGAHGEFKVKGNKVETFDYTLSLQCVLSNINYKHIKWIKLN